MDTPEQPIDDDLVKIFVLELNSQLRMANIAAANINTFLTGKDLDTDIFWYHMESLLKGLVAMANILWTQNKRSSHKRRSRQLRELFGLSGEKLPEDLRLTRNWFEHFDEKIDDWWRLSTRHNFADRNIMPLSDISGLDVSDYARFFDPITSELSVFGRSVNTREMLDYMSSITFRVNSSAKGIPKLAYLIPK